MESALIGILIAGQLASALGPLTTAEVAQHDRPEDCWLVVNGDVYDVTSFVADHPGGDAISRGCGKDATYFFEHRDEAEGHSAEAINMLPAYLLGRLGEDVPRALASSPPPSPRLATTRLGHQATADVGPSKSLALRVAHTISLDSDLSSGIAFQAGYSTGRFDFIVSDEQSAGVGSVQVKGKILSQHGEKERPLSLAFVAGAGMGYRAGAPALYGQLIAQHDLLDGRLITRANATASLSPGLEDSSQASLGGSLEFIPMPLHGLFVSVQSPMSNPGDITWNAGLSFYTRQHTFALYAASSPSLHPVPLSGEVAQALAIGMSLERAFLLGR